MYLHFADVHHHPPIHTGAFGHGYNLVGHMVVVGIAADAHAAVEALGADGLPLKADIVLVHVFRIERGIADVGVVEVVEGGHTEDALIKRAQIKVALFHGLIREKHSRGEFMHPRAAPCHHFACTASRGALVHHGVEHRGLRLEAPIGVGAGKCHKGGVAIGIGKIHQGGIEIIPLIVDRHIGFPIFQ